MSQFHPDSMSLSPALGQRNTDVVETLDAEPHAFAFVRQRWQNGILTVVGAGLMGVSGGFLLSQISATPGLKVQLAILGALLLIGALVMLRKAGTDLFGSIHVDRDGIHMRPTLAGFSVPWNRINRWEVCEDAQATYLPCLKVWVDGEEHPRSVPNGFLSHQDLHRLRKLLLVGRP
ncbi:MAG: hypothetical protein U0992_23865 [Planctomycetaceae bacterium]